MKNNYTYFSLGYPLSEVHIYVLSLRAARAGLSCGEVEAIVNNNDESLCQLAFAISPPGTAPDDDAIFLLTIAWLKLFIFQAHMFVVANIKTEITKKDEVGAHSFLPAAERDGRVREQQGRFQSQRFRGDKEYLHTNNDFFVY